jgi:hypothetical protein
MQIKIRQKIYARKMVGDWEGKTCDFADDDEDKADRFGEDHDKLRHFEEERAADEDALCDDPEDSEKFDVYQF